MSLRCVLGKLAGQTPATEEELRAMRAAAWHKQGILVVNAEALRDEWERQCLTNIGRPPRGGESLQIDLKGCVRVHRFLCVQIETRGGAICTMGPLQKPGITNATLNADCDVLVQFVDGDEP